MRFSTLKLEKFIPKSGQGWGGKESFLFEIDFWPKKVTFKTVISPGNEQNREVLRNALSKVKGTKEPSGKIWLVHFSETKRVDLTTEKYDDDSKIVEVIKRLLEENEGLIGLVEEEILKSHFI